MNEANLAIIGHFNFSATQETSESPIKVTITNRLKGVKSQFEVSPGNSKVVHINILGQDTYDTYLYFWVKILESNKSSIDFTTLAFTEFVEDGKDDNLYFIGLVGVPFEVYEGYVKALKEQYEILKL
jgi:hypothetical protein